MSKVLRLLPETLAYLKHVSDTEAYQLLFLKEKQKKSMLPLKSANLYPTCKFFLSFRLVILEGTQSIMERVLMEWILTITTANV